MVKKVALVILLAILIAVVVAAGLVGILLWRYQNTKNNLGQKSASENNLTGPQDFSARGNFTDWQYLERIALPDSYKIEGVDFIGGETDCCVCAALASIHKFYGKPDYEGFLDSIKPLGLNHDLQYITKTLEKYNLKDKFYIAHVRPETGSQTIDVANFLTNAIAVPSRQVGEFKDVSQALETLKKLVVLNIPVIVAIEADDRLKTTNPEEEMQDNDFYLVTGYDQTNITYYTLPNVQNQMSIAQFMEKWKLQDTKFSYGIMPGPYSLMFLAK